jgi:hypothetical protein
MTAKKKVTPRKGSATKKVSPKKKGKKTSANTGYREFLHENSKYLKESGVKLHGRGAFIRESAKVWKGVRDVPEWRENLDVILPQYFEGVVPETAGEVTTRKPVGSTPPQESKKNLNTRKITPEQISDFIKNAGFITFRWYDSVTEFDTLMHSEMWTDKCILRIIDDLGNFMDARYYDTWYRTVYTALRNDYKEALLPEESYPEFVFDGTYKEHGMIYVQYRIDYWDMIGIEDKLLEVKSRKKEFEQSRLKRRMEEKLRNKGIELPEEVERERERVIQAAPEDREVALARVEAGRREKAFAKEMDILKEEFKEGLWSKDEYRAEKEVLRIRYGL